MAAAIELHGVLLCPFAFRSRLTAREKGVAFEWLPFDAPEPDPRAAEHNPDRRSPLLYQDGYALTDSAVIMPYLDEAFDGPPLQPLDPKLRARMRTTRLELAVLEFDGRKPLSEEARAVVVGGLGALEAKLADGEPFLGGIGPSLADLDLWPWLPLLAIRRVLGPDTVKDFPRVAAYWERVQARASFRENNPYGTAPA